jgi:hypothetical protein
VLAYQVKGSGFKLQYTHTHTHTHTHTTNTGILFNLKKEENKLGVVVHTCNPSNSGGRGRRNMSSRLSQAKNKKIARHCLKKKK